MVFLGSWISGFFIIVTDAWMQHPVAYRLLPNGTYEVSSFWGFMLNPWAWLQYAHNMCGAVVTASFVVAATGAFYLLEKATEEFGRLFLQDRRHRRPHLLRRPDFPHRRPPRPLRGEISARSDCRHGRPLPHAEGRARRADRPAR